MALRAFPVIYARDVEAVAAIYTRLGFAEGFRMRTDDADPEGNLVVLAGASAA